MPRKRYISESQTNAEALIREISRIALPLNKPSDLDRLMDRIGVASFALLGEASLGTRTGTTGDAALFCEG